MFPLLISYFINKVNRIVIQCLDFAVERLRFLKNTMITKKEAYDIEEEFELCDVKLSSSYEIPFVTIKEFETESVIKGYHAYMNDWKRPEEKTYHYVQNLKMKLMNMLWLLLQTHG